jgi:RHS repeat-associated protein
VTRVNGAPGEDDPDGLATAVAYDDVYATFPVAVALGADEAAPLVTAISYQGCAAGLEPPPALGLACTVTAPGGLVEAYGYDALGRTVRREHASGLVVIRSHAFAPPGEPAEARVEERLLLQTPEPAELRSAAWLDGLGRVFRMEWPGTREQTIRVVRGFDARGRTASETLPHFVDPGDTGTPAGTPTRAISYDALGRVALVREHDGATHRRWSYAPWSVTEEAFFAAPAPGVPWQTRSRSRFDASGNRIAVGDYESGNFALWTTARYDALGRLLELADPLANDTARCLQWKGAYGWQSQGAGAICAPGGAYPETRVAWDTLGRRVRLDDPDSGVATWQYDDAGRLRVRAEGAPGQEVARLEYRHDAFGRVREQRVWPAGAGAAHASFVYGTDPGSSDHGRLIGVDALDGSQPPARYAYAYDGAGRLERVRQTSEGREFENAWAYDELGRVRVRVFPDGTDFVHHWDGARLARIFSHDSASTGAYYGWVLNRAEYDAIGRPTKLELGDRAEASGTEDPIAGIDWSYDEATARLDRITARRQPGMPPVYEVSHEWDGLGRLLSRSGIHRLLEEPIAESFAYDALGRLVTAVGRWEQPLGNPAPVAWHYGYDPLGNLRAQTSDNPDPATARERVWTHGDFRAPRRLTRFSEQRGGVESEETIAWDAAGRVVERVTQAPGRSAHFAWSPLGRAWQTGVDHSLEHDAFRNRVVERVGPSTIVHVGPDFEVDLLLGQAQKSIWVAGMRVATLASFYAPEPARGPWSLPRLPRPLAAAGDALPLVLLALGLVGIAALAVGRRSAWLALPGAGLLVAVLLWLPQPARPGGGWIGGPLPHGRHAERILFHLPDHLGSTRAVVDEWNAVVEARDYEPFGETVRHVGALDLQHRFTGKPWNQTAGVQDYGARLYDPAWGRFLAPDAIVESADARGSNAYAYALNRPTSLIDPTGNFTGLPVGGVVVFSFHDFVNVSTQIPGVEPMCCVSGRQTTWDRDGDGTDDARETGDVFPASLRTEVALILSLQRQHGDPFWVKLLEWLARDAAAQIIGVYGNVVGLLRGLQQTAKGVVQGDLRKVRDGLGSVAWALVPRHGWYGGPLWGLGGTRQSPITPMDGNFVTHDEGWREAGLPGNAANAGAIRSRADLQLVRDVWSLDQPQPGPFGQVYRLGVTIIFPTLAVMRSAI